MPHPVRFHDHKKFPQVVRFVSGEPVVSGSLPSKPSEPSNADIAYAKHMTEINAVSDTAVLHTRHEGPSLVPDAMMPALSATAPSATKNTPVVRAENIFNADMLAHMATLSPTGLIHRH